MENTEIKDNDKVWGFRDACQHRGVYIQHPDYFQGLNLYHICRSIYPSSGYISWRKELGIVNTL